MSLVKCGKVVANDSGATKIRLFAVFVGWDWLCSVVVIVAVVWLGFLLVCFPTEIIEKWD